MHTVTTVKMDFGATIPNLDARVKYNLILFCDVISIRPACSATRRELGSDSFSGPAAEFIPQKLLEKSPEANFPRWTG